MQPRNCWMCSFSFSDGKFKIALVFSALHLAPNLPIVCPRSSPSITAMQAFSIPNVMPAAMLLSRNDSSASRWSRRWQEAFGYLVPKCRLSLS